MKKVWIVTSSTDSDFSIWRTERGARAEAQRLGGRFVSTGYIPTARLVWNEQTLEVEEQTTTGKWISNRSFSWTVKEEPVQTDVIEDLAALAEDE